MTDVKILTNEKTDESLHRFAVVAVKQGESWVLVRHKSRNTWEIPGGHIEAGETSLEAAKRELFEETGAVDYDISEITSYSVNIDGTVTYGRLFFANVRAFADIPEGSEIAERAHFPALPEALAYPEIQPALYTAVQWWLNLQSSSDELWDVLDENRNPTGRLHRRGDFLKKGDYHLVVLVLLENSRGEFLITKRAPNKGYGNMWETTGGSAVAGDSSLAAALREVREETGFEVKAEDGRLVHSWQGSEVFVDIWHFRCDLDPERAVLQEGETCGIMYATPAKIEDLYLEGKFVANSYREIKRAIEKRNG
ncbi:MAG: NUDIX domain-containing protein [Clostridia bacterium]|nr:NUDIX domain-containing protein [Clostridia bacterium]